MVAMEALALSQRGGRSLELPGGVTLRQEHLGLVLTRSPERDCPYPELVGEHSILLPADVGRQKVVSGGPWLVTMQAGTAGERPEWAPSGGEADEWTACLDRGAVGGQATVRAWRPGDRIQPLGMRGQKKLQDLFTDLRVPRPWRLRVPILETGTGIAWVVGHRIADWAKVGPDASAPALWIRFSQDQAL